MTCFIRINKSNILSHVQIVIKGIRIFALPISQYFKNYHRFIFLFCKSWTLKKMHLFHYLLHIIIGYYLFHYLLPIIRKLAHLINISVEFYMEFFLPKRQNIVLMLV